MKSLTFFFVLIFFISLKNCQSVTISLPVPQKTITKVTLSISKLQDLLENFATLFQNKWAIYKRVELTKAYLQELNEALAEYNNVILGSGDTVNGNKNLVIGNQNNIEGSSNWVFVSEFTGKINGDLLVGKWRIELNKSNLIPISTRFAISFLKEERNSGLLNKYFLKNRELCKWEKWTNPTNLKSNLHWSRYGGYERWKTSNLMSKPVNNLQSASMNLFGTNFFGRLIGW